MSSLRAWTLGVVLSVAAFVAVAGAAQAPADSAGRPAPARPPEGLVKVGVKAPDFALPDADGKTVHLSDFLGKPLVLYFYPMDDTPGCTKEACSFRDDSASFDSLRAQVVGVSEDDPASHRRFRAKYGLRFPLLADTTATVARLYGVAAEFDKGGAKRVIAKRVTYLIDAKGIIRNVWPSVNPVGHSAEILASWTKLLPPETE